ncbi:hypothetical protein [Celeribacter persicus]|uniref:hypothetical protein n=1 Tax=Celeribacter persicus TaxID=1651082 RepID=UPI0011B29DDB|nr:hypothetical protein [Celeribacter persicus]
MRKVTPLTRKRAFATIKVVAKAMMEGEHAISYSDLAVRLGMPNETGRGLGPILDEAAHMCIEHNLPDVSAVVVTKESLLRGEPMPSMDSFVDGMWPITGVMIEDVPIIQAQVREFNWREVRQLNL